MRTQIRLNLTDSIERNDQEIEVHIIASYTPEIGGGYSYETEPEELDIDEVTDESGNPVTLTGAEARKIGAKLLTMGRAEAKVPRFHRNY